MYVSFFRQLPTSLEELLEYQWEQGAQFLMQQASQYDGTVLSTVKPLYCWSDLRLFFPLTQFVPNELTPLDKWRP